MKKKSVFDIEGMSRAINLPKSEIRRILGMPLGRNYTHADAEQARIDYFLAKPGSLRQAHALQKWILLFIKETAVTKNRQTAIDLYFKAPEDTTAKRAAMESIASFYGFTEFTSCTTQLNSAKTLKRAIQIAFNYLPCSKEFIGPKGKLIIQRNNCEKGKFAEAIVMSANKSDNRVLFAAYWKNAGFGLRAHWEKDGETLSKWNNEW